MNLIGPIRVNGRVGYVDRNGDVRVPFIYDGLGEFHEGLAPFEKDGKLGFIDVDNNVVIPPRFEPFVSSWHICRFSSGLAPVRIGGKDGYINAKGDFAIPCEYTECKPFVGDIALVIEPERYKRSVISSEGKILSRLNYHHVVEIPYAPDQIKVHVIGDSTEDLAPAFVNRFGELVAGPFGGFEDIREFAAEHSFLAPAVWRNPQAVGFLNRNWDLVIPCKFGAAKSFRGGMAPASSHKYEWGFINDSGDWTIQPEYSDARPFDGETASVSKGRRRNQHWIIINRQNEPISPRRFERILAEFDGGYRAVIFEGKTMVINQTCETIWATDVV